MSLIQTILANLWLSLGIMLLLWIVSVLKRDASVVDPYWGCGFVVLACFTAVLTSHFNARSILMILMVSIWGGRLSVYLLARNWDHGEDRRYRQMREKHGHRFWWVSLFTVFLLQGVILWFVAWPVIVALHRSPIADELHPWDAIGVFLWSIGLFFETVGDFQMARFKANPSNQGTVMNSGLWRYTRHPNYFGDFCVWWGIFLIAIPTGAWWTILSPVAMSIFLMKISGVGLLESDMAERRPAYREYQKTTNAFFPGPPKSA